MTECRNQEQKGLQKRLVRIVSVFLASLIKTKVINFNQDMLMSIQQFCLDFNQVPEANTLLRLVNTENYIKQ